MMRAGVLSSSYRFKVLSLDARGGRYLVMVDLTSVAAEESGRLSEIETLVALNAKSRFDIHVSGVYWRLSDYVTTGLTSRTSAQAAQKQSASLDPSEILAFKGAFAAATGGAAGLFASGEVVKSGPRSSVSLAPAEHIDHDEHGDRMSPLSATQHGELN
jgi:hypothetical protein